ncbi:hypothetical protein [Streptomyces spectabilis]|uniref:CO dehydrogenase/acetyl-CoA synthase gamma subunit (Corrinoid Fe-S protein) n=1 Tax=Streptomyces spectabilis TaxID=68270 RepID=A0A5P2X446_STRST|nr:hypothetical protein [Streptomyces spectabilis]MBB5103250.1 CO dehydrogenase/acetyl-CoA synthase gamma subunit (corrinoid Fe-S protein) [Streptomyces spectabilis]MCI3902442.1 hypothetical protein [Streptomyces spectabilis]QEV59787.1 hypothetical protein CP982_14445 [Streptomyces spectabilis]GGV13861.1 hypothetical protein GCM10010245_24140 [Streptomyces spectabilis]
MSTVSETATAPSTLPEQSIRITLAVEIMIDLDTGRPMLLASTDANEGDIHEVTPDEFLALAHQARAEIDRMARLALTHARQAVRS